MICIILDDEHLAIQALTHTLKQQGMRTVYGFQQVEDALAFVQKQHKENTPLMVLADYNLNDAKWTGSQFLAAIPEVVGKCLVSANPTKVQEAQQHGWPFLQKPVRAEQLAKLLTSAHSTTSSSTTSSHAI